MSDEPLTPEEKKLAANAANARRRHLRGKVEKPAPVTPEQYAERLKNSLRKDATLMDTVRDSNIAKEKAKWSKRVRTTFAEASSDMPVVLERVERLRVKRGLHKTSIVFSGAELGRGKTWQAYSYLNQVIASGGGTSGQIIFGTEGATIARIATSGFERAGNMRELLQESHRFFFIDDVGQGYYYKEESRHEVWFELIDHIYTQQLTLILTTNLAFTEQSLGKWIGFRAFDRLKSLVGDDGFVAMSGINKREEVLRENEAKFQNQKAPRRR